MTLAPLAPVPQSIVDITAASKAQNRPPDAEVPLVPYDQPTNIKQAVAFLTEAPIATEGDTGDSQTLKTACWVRDYAISQTLCLELMTKHWNDKCEPPWPLDELAVKVANAYRYAQNRPGERTAGALFANISFPLNTSMLPHPAELLSGPNGLTLFDTFNDVYHENLEPKWLIKRYIEQQSTVVIYGEHSSMKSFIALDMALCVATGTYWCGHRTQQGAVFYIAGEGRSGIKKRLRVWCNEHPHLNYTNVPFYPSKGPVYFDILESINVLVQDIQSQVVLVGVPRLLIIDTLAKNIGALDESSSRDMGTFIKYVEKYIRNVYGCAVIIVHHCGHSKKERMRGSSAIGAGVDAMYLVIRKENEMGTRLCRPSKMKEGEAPPSIYFKAKVVTLGRDKDDDAITSLVLHPYSSGLEAPQVFNASVTTSTQENLLELLKKPRSCSVVGGHSVWSLPGFTDKVQLGFMLEDLITKKLIVLDEGFYRGL